MASGIERGGDLRLEELVPYFAWTDDSNCHCLLIDLPGFKKEEVKLQVDDFGHVIVTGERKASENKLIKFRQSYKVPENSNIEETSANFEDEILYVMIPKKSKINNEENGIGNSSNNNEPQNEPKQAENENNIQVNEKNNFLDKRSDDEEIFHDYATPTLWYANTVIEIMKEKLKKKKWIIVTAVLAFSLGVIVANKLQSRED